MSNINWPAIHAVHQQYKGSLGQGSQPVPQPQGMPPMHKMMTHAMATRDHDKDGESHASMVIRALSEHLKRITPNVSKIHETGGAVS